MKNLKSNTKALELSFVIVSALLSSVPALTNAAGYLWKEIPAPQQITVPAGDTARKICRSINAVGQVACNLQIIETLTPTALDRGKIPKIFASYAYKWDSNAPTSPTNPLLLSSTNADTFDNANVINDNGVVGGAMDTLATKAPQATLWVGNIPSLLGAGAITDLDDFGDYIKNNRLFVNNKAIFFPGNPVRVQAINPSAIVGSKIIAGGLQLFSSTIGESGTGMLYRTKPAATKPQPWFALSSIVAGFAVRDVADNGNFVMSGIPGTAGGLFAYKCASGIVNCQPYFPTVGSATAGKTNRWITLNGINNSGTAVGTDGGIGIRINPLPSGKEVNLNLEVGIIGTGLSISEATGINTSGQIIGAGLLGSKRSFFLLTPTP